MPRRCTVCRQRFIFVYRASAFKVRRLPALRSDVAYTLFNEIFLISRGRSRNDRLRRDANHIGLCLRRIVRTQQLALLSCATVLLILLATRFLSQKVRRFSRRRQALLGQLNGTVEEMVSGYRTVVAYNHQDVTTEEFCKTADSLTKAGIQTDIFSGVMGPIMNCIGNIGFVIIAAFGGYFAVNGLISVGVISAFIVYAKQFSRPINEIAQIFGHLQRGHPDGKGHPKRHAEGDGEPHQHRHRPPAVHHPGRGPNRGDGPGPHRGAGTARGPAGQERQVL